MKLYRALKVSILLAAPLSLHAQSIEGTSYYLPKAALRFTVKVEKTVYEPGKLSQYTRRYMKEDTPQEGSTTYRLLGVEMDPIAVRDTSKHFTLVTDKKHSILKVSLTEDGQLLAINADAQEPQAPIRQLTPAAKPQPLNPNDFMTEDILRAGSTAKMAELTAQEIYDIRDSRNQLSRGEADNLPKDGAQLQLMYDNMARQEQALLQLFYGTTTRDTTCSTIDFTPTEEGRTVLFRFSKYYGLVASDDLSGTPYYIGVTDEHSLAQSQQEEEGKKKEDKNDIGLRVAQPGRIRVTLEGGGKTLGSYDVQAPQFGTVESLSGELFGKKQSAQITLNPLTGGVKEIKQFSLE